MDDAPTPIYEDKVTVGVSTGAVGVAVGSAGTSDTPVWETYCLCFHSSPSRPGGSLRLLPRARRRGYPDKGVNSTISVRSSARTLCPGAR
jgi:hypothetical protein